MYVNANTGEVQTYTGICLMDIKKIRLSFCGCSLSEGYEIYKYCFCLIFLRQKPKQDPFGSHI